MKKNTNWSLVASKELDYGELSVQSIKGQIALVAGVGKKKLNVSRLRKLLNKCVNFLIEQNAKLSNVSFVKETGIEEQTILFSIFESNYSFNKYKKAPSKSLDLSALSKKLSTESKILLQSIQITKDLVNEPPNIITPKSLAEFCTKLAKSIPNLSVKTLNEAQIKKLGLTAFLAVGQASENKPYLIEFNYNPQAKTKAKKVGLVGKGLTYDTGGLSLKPNRYMYGMKSDMAGAATVIGIMNAISKLKLKVPVTGLILACENAFGDNSYRPGDVLKTLKGKTIEVVDTDAEGRITLADALTFMSQKKDVETIIDYATLTGSCSYTLGSVATGAFTNDEKTLQIFSKAADKTGELVWELPMFEEYRSNLDSPIADILQCDGRPDASMAAIFLKEFLVGEKKWLHLDIAGTAFLDNDDDYFKAGATGRSVWSTVEFLKSCQN